MLYIETDGTIRLTRGDSACLEVPITVSGTNPPESYSIEPTDVLRFTLKKSVKDSAPLFQKVITGSNVFNILPSDTKSLAFGKYVYDVELQKSLTEIYTVIEKTTFEIREEVS